MPSNKESMPEHLAPDVRKRIQKIAYISAVLYPCFLSYGWMLEQPTSTVQWVGRIGIFLWGLYTIPAVYLTLQMKFRLNWILCFIVAYGLPGTLGLLYVFRFVG